MYRLLKVKKSYFCKAITECAEGQSSSPLPTCSLCTKYFTWDLSMTDKSTRERTATITKLKPNHISRLIEQPETSLDQLHRLKFASPRRDQIQQSTAANTTINAAFLRDAATFNHKETSTYSTEIQSSGEFDDTTLTSHEDVVLDEISSGETGLSDELHDGVADARLQNSLEDCGDAAVADPPPSRGKRSETFKMFKETRAEEWKSWTSRFKQLEMDYKERFLTQTTEARLQALVNCGARFKAESELRKVKRGPRSVKFIRNLGPLFDTVLEALARKGELSKTLDLIQMMDEKHVEMTLKSFRCLFECLANNTSCLNDEIIGAYLSIMEQKGFKLDDIFLQSYFGRNQREMILTLIRRIRPEYEPPVVPVDNSYHVELLKDINDYGSPSYITPAEGLIHPDDMAKLVDEQVRNEENGYVKIPNIWCEDSDPEMLLKRRVLQKEILDQWRKALSASVRTISNPRGKTATSLGESFAASILQTVNFRDIVDIVLRELTWQAENSESFSPPFYLLKRRLGLKVKEKYDVIQKARDGVLDKQVKLYHDYCREYLNENQRPEVKNTRHLWLNLISKDRHGPSHMSKKLCWNKVDSESVGAILYSFVLKNCKINANFLLDIPPLIVPAFYTVFRSKRRHLHEELKPHPALTRIFRAICRENLTMDVDMVPMVCPPVPWTSFDSGAHLLLRTTVIRPTPVTEVVKDQIQQRLAEMPKENFYPSFDSLNQLGSIPWTVNTKVLDVVTTVFKSGGSKDLSIPLAPTDEPPEPPVNQNLSQLERSLILKQRAIARRHKAENFALWCEVLYRLSLAHSYRNRVIWLPHNMDFRGRVYPIAPYLQHMSGDMARSLLCFARGERLGPDGLDWLKIHLVNLTGLKKKDPLSVRLEFANTMLPEIIDSAKNPLNGRKWWMESEEPWQTLAVCFEIVDAIESGDPQNYVGRFPVHQDGSCNGLQHYAALGRDAPGARSVNLSLEDKPQDIYACVAEIVERHRMKDAAEGVTVAKELEGCIKRKIIKQTVMTTVYGVTRYGARMQIAKQLNALKNFDREKVWAASLYLTSKTFESLNEMFTSTKEIQNWLTDSAQIIAQLRHECVEWVTPLGLLVIQPYTKPPTIKKKKHISASEKEKSQPQEMIPASSVERPNVMKQKNAFPPNFIHSLDSSHMMLTGLHCERAGITFVSVHDCFWVHPCNVHSMNKICREQFVALHSEPILENLSRYFYERYGFQHAVGERSLVNGMFLSVPQRGTFDLREILKSVYFFS